MRSPGPEPIEERISRAIRRGLPVAVLGLSVSVAQPGWAQTISNIVLDGSLPGGRLDDLTAGQTPAAESFTIEEDMGHQVGPNLFHSFRFFDLGSEDTATFVDDGLGPTIGNVIARVTGMAPSHIDGALRSQIPDADFFFLNPSGVFFGDGASIDVPASFAVGTPHALFYSGTGTSLSLTDPSNAVLESAPPSAFGFLGTTPAADITVESIGTAPVLRVSSGAEITLIGGDVRVDDGAFVGAPGGRIQLAAVGSAAAVVPLDLPGYDPTTTAGGLGEVRVANSSTLNTSDFFDLNGPQGAIVIRGGRFVATGLATLEAGGRATTDGAAIDVAVVDSIQVLGGSQLRTQELASLESGGISLSADSIRIDDGALLRARTRNGDRLGLLANAIHLAADAVEITNGGRLSSETTGASSGGAIRIETTGDVTIRDDAYVATSTTGSGSGGSIRITADRLTLDRSGSGGPAGLIQTTTELGSSGDGGDIDLDVGSLRAEAGGQVFTSALGFAPAGSIDVVATDTVVLSGDAFVGGGVAPSGAFSRVFSNADGGAIRIEGREIRIEDGAAVSSQTASLGVPGEITLVGHDLVRVAGEGRLGSIVNASTLDRDGASIQIDAARLEVVDGAAIDISSRGGGDSGSITIVSEDVLVGGTGPSSGNRARLAARAEGVGDARGISIVATGRVEIEAGGEVTASALPGASGNPGDVTIDAASIEVRGDVGAEATRSLGGNVTFEATETVDLIGGRVTVASADTGDAGSIRIAGDAIRVVEGAEIVADAEGFGGNIELQATSRIEIVDARIDATSRGGANTMGLAGGNIAIDPPVVVVSRSSVVAQGFGNANGGNITIAGNPLIVSGDSTISASSEFGTEGRVVVNAPNDEVTGKLGALPGDFVDAASRLEASCLAQSDVGGSFTARVDTPLPAPPDAVFDPPAGEVCESP